MRHYFPLAVLLLAALAPAPAAEVFVFCSATGEKVIVARENGAIVYVAAQRMDGDKLSTVLAKDRPAKIAITVRVNKEYAIAGVDTTISAAGASMSFETPDGKGIALDLPVGKPINTVVPDDFCAMVKCDVSALPASVPQLLGFNAAVAKALHTKAAAPAP